MSGVHIRTVQELLGHAGIATTMRYVHYLQRHAEDAVGKAQLRERGGRKLDGAKAGKDEPNSQRSP